jgi:hypothetical protein
MTDDLDLCAEDDGRPGSDSAAAGLPAWLTAIREAADETYDANPGKPPSPEVEARIRRALFPPAPDGNSPGRTG